MHVTMPVMKGLEASKAIRQAGGVSLDGPIIAVTASPTLEGSNKKDKAGVTDVLMKPVSRKVLYAALAKWSSERHTAWMCAAWSKHRGK